MDNRHTWAIKDSRITPDFKDLVRKAAKHRDVPLYSYCAEALERQARADLGLDPLPDERKTLMELAQDIRDIKERLQGGVVAEPDAPAPGGVLGRLFGPKRT